MATGNFKSNCNTKNIYAYGIMRDYIDDLKARCEDEGTIFDEDAPINETDFYFWSQDEQEAVTSTVYEECLRKFGKYDVYRPNDRRANDRDASVICVCESTVDFAGYGWPIRLQVTTMPGYYEGGQLDIEVRSILDDFDEVPDADDLARIMWNDTDLNRGLITMLAPKLAKRLEAALDDFTAQIDEILANSVRHKLGVTARFSNGETWYAECA